MFILSWMLNVKASMRYGWLTPNAEIMTRAKTEHTFPLCLGAMDAHLQYLHRLPCKTVGKMTMVDKKSAKLVGNYLGLFAAAKSLKRQNRQIASYQPNLRQQHDIRVFLSTYVHNADACLDLEQCLTNVAFSLNIQSPSRLKQVLIDGVTAQNANYFFLSLPLMYDWIQEQEDPGRYLNTLHEGLAFYHTTLKPEHGLYLDLLCQKTIRDDKSDQAALLQQSQNGLELAEFLAHLKRHYEKSHLAFIYWLTQNMPSAIPCTPITTVLDWMEEMHHGRHTRRKLATLSLHIQALPLKERLQVFQQHVLQPRLTSPLLIAAALRSPSIRALLLDRQTPCLVFSWEQQRALFLYLCEQSKHCYDNEMRIKSKLTEVLQSILLVGSRLLYDVEDHADKYLAKRRFNHLMHKGKLYTKHDRVNMIRLLLNAHREALDFDAKRILSKKEVSKYDKSKLFHCSMIDAIESYAHPNAVATSRHYHQETAKHFTTTVAMNSLEEYFQKIEHLNKSHAIEQPSLPQAR